MFRFNICCFSNRFLHHKLVIVVNINYYKMANLNKLELPASFKSKYLGVLILAIVQTLVGIIHVVSGLILLFAPSMLPLSIPVDVGYSVYTFLYGLLSVLFAYGLWVGRRFGWIGTVIVSTIVILIDLFTLLSLPLIAGVPKFAAIIEIPYSILVILYLIQPSIRKIFTRIK